MGCLPSVRAFCMSRRGFKVSALPNSISQSVLTNNTHFANRSYVSTKPCCISNARSVSAPPARDWMRATTYILLVVCRYFCIELRRADGDKAFMGFLAPTLYNGL